MLEVWVAASNIKIIIFIFFTKIEKWSSYCGYASFSVKLYKHVFTLFILQNVREGMLLLGCVKEVADFEVTVSLPCGLQGFLSIKNICESYTKVLSEQLDSSDMEVSLQSLCRVNIWQCRSLSSNDLMYSVLNTFVQKRFSELKKSLCRRFAHCRTSSVPAWCWGVRLPSWTFQKEAYLASSCQLIPSWSTRHSRQALWKRAW